jgi:hypothetical protein
MCYESRIMSYEIRFMIYELSFWKCSFNRLFKDSLTHSRNKLTLLFEKHSQSTCENYSSYSFSFFFATLTCVLKSLSNFAKIVLIRRSRSELIMRFASTNASRMMKRTKTTKKNRALRDLKRENEDQIRWRTREKKENRIRRRCRRLIASTTNDSKFKSFMRLRTNSNSTMTIAYLISFEKHENELFTNCCKDCISFSSSYNDIRCSCF